MSDNSKKAPVEFDGRTCVINGLPKNHDAEKYNHHYWGDVLLHKRGNINSFFDLDGNLKMFTYYQEVDEKTDDNKEKKCIEKSIYFGTGEFIHTEVVFVDKVPSVKIQRVQTGSAAEQYLSYIYRRGEWKEVKTSENTDLLKEMLSIFEEDLAIKEN
jgi:hypothetical protein